MDLDAVKDTEQINFWKHQIKRLECYANLQRRSYEELTQGSVTPKKIKMIRFRVSELKKMLLWFGEARGTSYDYQAPQSCRPTCRSRQ